MYLMLQSHHRVESGTIHRRNEMSGARIVRHNLTNTYIIFTYVQQPARTSFFDDFDIVENILLLYVGIGTLNVILANISETPIEITDIS